MTGHASSSASFGPLVVIRVMDVVAGIGSIPLALAGISRSIASKIIIHNNHLRLIPGLNPADLFRIFSGPALIEA